jgi:hypothetical protein
MANWASSGRVTNPIANDVIVDSGAFAADGTRRPLFVLASSVAGSFELQHRDAANAVTLKSQIITLSATGTFKFDVPSGIDTLAGERLRLIMVAGVTGLVSCSVFT